jgi:poly-gamma-glutamate synthesis protein (capsule biosynthesis protein)
MDIVAGVVAFVMGWFASFFPSASLEARVNGPAPETATVLFAGDMMFDRSVRAVTDEKGGDFIFSCIAPTLRSADLVVANLEGPITSFPSKSLGSEVGAPENFTFTFPTSTAALLKRHNISLVNLGNNHIMNFSREGLLETKQWLESADVRYFGDPDAVEHERTARITINTIPFSFVNWSDWTSDKTDHTVQEVKNEADAGRVVVVYTHWGDEYVPPPKRVRDLAHSFADAGAAIVVGSHPHIVQENEFYNGAHIYYSLGNFIFDQYFSEEVKNGLLLKVRFTAHGVAGVEEIPVVLNQDRRTCLRAER